MSGPSPTTVGAAVARFCILEIASSAWNNLTASLVNLIAVMQIQAKPGTICHHRSETNFLEFKSRKIVLGVTPKEFRSASTVLHYDTAKHLQSRLKPTAASAVIVGH
jgi:hypothetical protein